MGRGGALRLRCGTMVYRGLYHFTQAVQRGQASATDPVAYLAANARWLGFLKRR